MILPEKSKASSREALQVRNKFLMVALLTIICFGSFVMGYELVAVSMLEKEIQLHNNLSSDSLHYYLTLVTITLPLGAILGCLLTKHLEERGENRLMMISDVVVILSSLLMVTSLDITTLSAGRFLMGVSCGISSSIVPPYLISVSPLEWKGMIGSLHQLFVTIGVGFSFYLGQRMEELSVFSISNWRSYLLLPILYSSFRLTILSIFK
jgi:MFS family permease